MSFPTCPNMFAISRGNAKVVQTKSLPPQQLLKAGAFGHGGITTMSVFSDDEPIYDHVASDDDYYNIPEKNGEEPVRKAEKNKRD